MKPREGGISPPTARYRATLRGFPRFSTLDLFQVVADHGRTINVNVNGVGVGLATGFLGQGGADFLDGQFHGQGLVDLHLFYGLLHVCFPPKETSMLGNIARILERVKWRAQKSHKKINHFRKNMGQCVSTYASSI